MAEKPTSREDGDDLLQRADALLSRLRAAKPAFNTRAMLPSTSTSPAAWVAAIPKAWRNCFSFN